MMFTPRLKYILIMGSLLSVVTLSSGCALLPSTKQATQFNGGEVRSLFKEKTVVSENINTGTLSISYYTKDGKVRQLRNDRVRTGTWRVQKNGQKCMQMQSRKESCRVVKLDTDNVYRKYKPDIFLSRPVVFYHSFVSGNRLNDEGFVKNIKLKAEITSLQRLLTKKGYSPGPVDGVWGPRSRQALLQYQEANGLQKTGKPGREVIDHISGR